MKRNSMRGAVDLLVVMFVAGLAAGVFAGNWNPFYRLLGKEPPTAQVTALQAQLVIAGHDANAKAAQVAAAKDDERAKLESQIRAAQQDNVGASEALNRVPAEHRTAETSLAAAMTQRVSLKLAAAIGKLPSDQQAAMVVLITQALSEKQSEVDEATRKLAARDQDFTALSAVRDELVRVTIPALEQQAQSAQKHAAEVAGKLTEKTNLVKEWADAKFESDAKSRTLSASLDRVWHYALWLGGIWAFLAFVLPGLIKHMEAGRIKNALRDTSGFALNPLLYWDARKKIKSASNLDGTPDNIIT